MMEKEKEEERERKEFKGKGKEFKEKERKVERKVERKGKNEGIPISRQLQFRTYKSLFILFVGAAGFEKLNCVESAIFWESVEPIGILLDCVDVEGVRPRHHR